jgi:hypothetical protein
MSSARQQLRIGDNITLNSTEFGTYIASDGIVTSDCTLADFTLHLEDTLFTVTLPYIYSANREYHDYVEIHKETGLDEEKRNILHSLEKGVKNEIAMNHSYFEKLKGKPVNYGDSVQFLHRKSGKFITVLPTDLAHDERENLRIVLDPIGSSLSMFTLRPRTALSRNGDPVLTGDEVFLTLTKGDSQYLHISQKPPRDLKMREVNCSTDRSAVSLSIYQSGAKTVEDAILASDWVYLFDPESTSNLTIAVKNIDDNNSGSDDDDDDDDADSNFGSVNAGTALFNDEPSMDFTMGGSLAEGSQVELANEIFSAYESDGVLLQPLDQFQDTNSIWVIEKTGIGGLIEPKYDKVRIRHLNRGVYLAIDAVRRLNHNGDEEEALVVSTSLDKTSEKVIFKLEVGRQDSNFLTYGCLIKLEYDGCFIGRGNLSKGSSNLEIKVVDFVDDALPLIVKKFSPNCEPVPSQIVGYRVSHDASVFLSIKNFWLNFVNMVDIPKGTVGTTIFPNIDQEDYRFFQDFTTRAALFVQGHPLTVEYPASTQAVISMEELATTAIMTDRQSSAREQGLVHVVLIMIYKLLRITEIAEDTVARRVVARGAEKLKIHDPQFVVMGKAVLHQCFFFVYHCIREHHANQVYVANFLSTLLGHVGEAGQDYASKCVNEMLSKNMSVQDEKIGSRELDIFINKLRKSRMDPTFLTLVRSCCACQGNGIDNNQGKVCDRLFKDYTDAVIQLHADHTYLLRVEWNTDSLYYPKEEKYVQTVLGWEIVTEGLPYLSITWTTSSIDFSPLGLFGKLTVPIEELYAVATKESQAQMEMDFLSSPKRRRTKVNAMSKSKVTIAQYFIEQLYLFSDLCLDRNYIAMNTLAKLFPYTSLATMMKMPLSEEVKGAAINLMITLHVDSDPQSMSVVPRFSRTWSDIKENEIPALPLVDVNHRYKFVLLQEMISDYITKLHETPKWTALSLNILRLLNKLVKCDFYGEEEKLKDIIINLVKGLDRRGLHLHKIELDQVAPNAITQKPKPTSNTETNSTFSASKISIFDATSDSIGEEMKEGDSMQETSSKLPTEYEADIENSDNWQGVALEILESMNFLIFILLLVLVATVIVVYETITGSTESDTPGTPLFLVSILILAFFIIEITLRMYCIKHVRGNLKKFWANPLNWVDIAVVLIDIAFLMIPAGDESAGGDAGQFAKTLRLVRMVRLTRIFRAARILQAMSDIEKEVFADWELDPRYFKSPRVQTQTMVQIVDVLVYVQKIIDDRHLSLLLRAFYQWYALETEKTPGELFEEVVQSSCLNLEGENADFNKICIDATMYHDPDLVQSALDILVAHHSTRSAMKRNIAKVQLILSFKSERAFKLNDGFIRSLESNAETQELWGELKTSDDRAMSSQTHDIIDTLVNTLRTKHQNLIYDEFYGIDTESQDLFRNLGLYDICFKVFALMESIEEDDDRNLDEAGENTKAIVKSCMNLMFFLVYDNPINQARAYDDLEQFLEMLGDGIDAHKVVKAIFYNNEQNMKRIPSNRIDEAFKKIVVQGRQMELLLLPASTTYCGNKNMLENQYSVVKNLTAPGRLEKIASYFCPPEDPKYNSKRKMMKKLAGKINLTVEDMPPKLQYHMLLIDVLSGCTVGRLNITTLEAKVQQVFSLSDLCKSILDESCLTIMKNKMLLHLFNAFLEVELPVLGLQFNAHMWQILATAPKYLEQALDEMKKLSPKLGFNDTVVDRRIVENMIALMLVIPGFLNRYYDPEEFDLSEANRTVSVPEDRVTLNQDERNSIFSALFDALCEIYTFNCPFLLPHQMVYVREALDAVHKSFRFEGEGKNAPALPKLHTTKNDDDDDDDGVPVLKMKSKEEMIIEKFDEFKKLIDEDETTKENIAKENMNFVKELEAIPSVTASVKSDIRYEPFIDNLMRHVQGRLVANEYSGEKSLDAPCELATQWILRAFRNMIENAWGMTIDERDDDGGEEQDEASAELTHAFNSNSVTDVCCDLLSYGLDAELKVESMNLLVAMLFKEGGALDVQVQMYDRLSSSNSVYFFREMHQMIEDLIAWHQWNEVIILEDGDEPDLPDAIINLRFMQLMCEGHYGSNQDILREQPNNEESVNVLDDYVNYLDVLMKYRCKTNTTAALSVTAVICEVIQGPCVKNQMHFALNTKLIEVVNRVLSSQVINDCDSDDEVELKKSVIDILQALLEGQVHPSPIYDRLLNMLHIEVIMALSEPPASYLKRKALSEEENLLQIECTVLLEMFFDYQDDIRAKFYDEDDGIPAVRDDIGSVEVVWMGILQ